MLPELYNSIRNKIIMDQIVAWQLSVTVDSYYSLRFATFQNELRKEQEVVLSWNIDEFKTRLIKRLAIRNNRPDVFTTFDTFYNSDANRLYGALVRLVLSPRNMGAMLGYVAPKVKHQLKITQPTELPHANMTTKQQNEFFQNFEPVLQLVDAKTMAMSPVKANFRFLVIAGPIVLDVRDIAEFPLGAHANLKALLEVRYPQLAQKLYNFNAAMRNLANDITLYQTDGMTPNQALQNLSKRLYLSAAHVTGNVSQSSPEAMEALSWFQPFYHHLSEELRTEINRLTNRAGQSLETILVKIENNECPRQIAVMLDDLLEKNRFNIFLNARPNMTKELLGELLNKYKYQANEPKLDCAYNTQNIVDLPITQVFGALRGLDFKTLNELTNWIINFDTLFFTMILPSIQVPELLINMLLQLSMDNVLTPEQKRLMAKTLVQTATTVFTLDTLFSNIVKTQDATLIQATVPEIKKDGQWFVDVISKRDNHGWSLLMYCQENVDLFKLIYGLIPKNKRLEVLKIVAGNDENVLAQSENLEVRDFIIQQFPKQWQTPIKVMSILTENTILYVSTIALFCGTPAMKLKFEPIHKKIDDYYARSMYQAYTDQYITNFETRMMAIIEGEFTGIMRPLVYYNRFFTYCNAKDINIPTPSPNNINNNN